MPPDASQGGMNRRDFLKAASATGLLIAVQLPLPRKLHAAPAASGCGRGGI